MKKVLFLTTGMPVPGSGTAERTRSIYNALSAVAETQIYHLKLYQPGEDTAWYWRKRKYLLQDFRVDPRFFADVERLHKEHRFDAFVCRYFVTTLAGCDRLGPSIFEFDDLPEVMPGPPIPGWKRIGWELTHRRLETFRTILVTKTAIAKLRHPDVRVLPCTSTAAPSDVGALEASPDCKRMLFVGSLRWPPNRDGLLHFVNNVLPLIRREVPAAEVRAVGEDSDQLGDLPGVSGAGFVADLAAEYREAAVVICPIYRGAGANVKLAEAALFGKAAVATPNCALGFAGVLQPGRDLLTGHSDRQMAAACISLLTNTERRDEVAANALRAARQHLSQPAIDRIVKDALTSCW